MEIGLFLNTRFPEGDNLAPRIAEMAMQVRTARDVGFASVLFPHHYLTAPLQMFQITPLMAYLLREAEGMIVAPGILILPPAQPGPRGGGSRHLRPAEQPTFRAGRRAWLSRAGIYRPRYQT